MSPGGVGTFTTSIQVYIIKLLGCALIQKVLYCIVIQGGVIQMLEKLYEKSGPESSAREDFSGRRVFVFGVVALEHMARNYDFIYPQKRGQLPGVSGMGGVGVNCSKADAQCTNLPI